MAILHKNINNANDIHVPKWLPSANNGDYAFKNEKGELESIDELLLPGALNFVDGSVAPPTTNTGDIYILSSGASVNAGWGGVALQDWVRYDGTAWNSLTPQKSSLCYDKTADSLKFFNGTAWAAIGGGGGGILGIADSSGAYTYYTNYTAAMSAASAGDTVEQFGNINETNAVTITVPADVSINMNGYSYSLTGQGINAFDNLSNNNFQKVKFINGKIIHSSSGGAGIALNVGNQPILDCTGLTVVSDGKYVLNFNTSGAGVGRIIGGSYIKDGNTASQWAGIIEGHVTGAYFNSDVNVLGFRVIGGSISNSLIEGLITVLSSGELNNNRIIGGAQGHAVANEGTINNCYIKSNTHRGVVQTQNGKILNSHIISDANNAILTSGTGTEVSNCKIYSATTYAIFATSSAKICNSEIESLAFSAARLNIGIMFSCKVKSFYNNASGDAITLTQNDGSEIINCFLVTTNANAKAITGNQSGKFKNCTAKGMTQFTDNSTNTISTTADSFNNQII